MITSFSLLSLLIIQPFEVKHKIPLHPVIIEQHIVDVEKEDYIALMLHLIPSEETDCRRIFLSAGSSSRFGHRD